MRFLIVCIFVLFGSIEAYSTQSSSAVLPACLTERLELAKQAVWRIRSDNYTGTAFFVSPHHVVTNWHGIHNKNMASLSLQQEGNGRKLSIKRLVSVSVLHNLVLLETEESAASHLTVRKGVVSDKEDLFLPDYSKGVFKYTLKTSPLKDFKDDVFIYFSVNRTNLDGHNGGPVLDANNRVVGVFSEGMHNYIRMIKGSILRDFIGSNMGLIYEGQSLQTFIEEEINNLQKQARRGSPIAQYTLAMMYYYGEGVEENLPSALKWYQRAAEQGFVPAQYSLGEMYDYGMKENFSSIFEWLQRARKWYQMAAAQGLALAQYSLGEMYYKGEGGEKNLYSARHWYWQAAEQGYVPAQHRLGLMYYKGEGGEEHLYLARRWYRQAAEQGYAPAQYSLGLMYDKGEGVEQNLSLALKWYQRAAEQDYPPAQHKFGVDFRGAKQF